MHTDGNPGVSRIGAALLSEACPQAPLAGRKVLLVDDNVDGRESLAMLLAMQGHQVCTAGDGVSALELARTFLPEVALLDIGLPDMDGYELVSMLRAEPLLKSMRVVAVTGYGRKEDVKAAQAAGFDAHVLKPALLEQFEHQIALSRPDGVCTGC